MPAHGSISVEIELGWGFHDKVDPQDVPELSADGQAERDTLDWFLDLCDDAGVPVTFNIVGHLLLESCNGCHDGPHSKGWFARDPGTNAAEDPLFYAPELATRIHKSEINHEVCTHTFSHILLDEVDTEVINWEMNQVNSLHKETIVSLVPPRHRNAPYDVLQKNGIEIIRRAIDEVSPSSSLGWYLWALTRDHPVGRPQVVDGMVETQVTPLMTLTASFLSRGVSEPHPAYRVIPYSIRQRIHKNFLQSGLTAAINEDSHIHYWTHLYNMANDAQHEPIRSLIQSLGSNDNVEMLRMADLTKVYG